MLCFNHAESPAVGICGGCLKALCKDCAREDVTLACSNQCVDKVQRFWMVTDKSAQIFESRLINTQGQTNKVLGWVFLVGGILIGLLHRDFIPGVAGIILGATMLKLGKSHSKLEKLEQAVETGLTHKPN